RVPQMRSNSGQFPVFQDKQVVLGSPKLQRVGVFDLSIKIVQNQPSCQFIVSKWTVFVVKTLYLYVYQKIIDHETFYSFLQFDPLYFLRGEKNRKNRNFGRKGPKNTRLRYHHRYA